MDTLFDKIKNLNLGQKDTRTLPGGQTYNVDQASQMNIGQVPPNMGIGRQESLGYEVKPPEPITQTEFKPSVPESATQVQQQKQLTDEDVARMSNSISSIMSGGKSLMPTQTGGDYIGDIFKLQAEQAADSRANRGLYSMPEGVVLSPEQQDSIRQSADRAYTERFGALAYPASMQVNQLKTGSPLSSSLIQKASDSGYKEPKTGLGADTYIQALLTSPKIGSSNVDTNRILQNLSNMNPEQQISTVKRLAYANLSKDEQAKVDMNDGVVQQVDSVVNAFSDVNTNPYMYLGETYTNFFGRNKDPEYVNLQSQIASVVLPVRKDYFGASLTPNEQNSANQMLPDLAKDDMRAIIIKMQNLAALAQFANDKKIAKELGLPAPKLDDYWRVNADGTPREQKQVSGGVNTNSLIDALKTEGYDDQQIQQFLKSKGMGFNQVGNTTASIELGSRLAKVNNNPGNLRFVGQQGATQGEGGFAKFNTPEEGLAALQKQIQLDSSRGHTLASFIAKYAPPGENDTTTYIRQAVNSLGVTPTTPVNQIPIQDLVRFMALKESSTKIL